MNQDRTQPHDERAVFCQFERTNLWDQPIYTLRLQGRKHGGQTDDIIRFPRISAEQPSGHIGKSQHQQHQTRKLARRVGG